MVRSYTEMLQYPTFLERFRYLALKSTVGLPTFGYDRWMNQDFYASYEWKQMRNFIIVRDEGLDLGIPGQDIYSRLYVHHMNPMTVEELKHGDENVLNPEFLITTSQRTHNAIHYGDERLLPREPVERRRGDTKLW